MPLTTHFSWFKWCGVELLDKITAIPGIHQRPPVIFGQRQSETNATDLYFVAIIQMSTITTCNLKVICSQIEPFTFATMSVLSNMFDINIYFNFDCFSNRKETFTKMLLETAAAKLQCNFI